MKLFGIDSEIREDQEMVGGVIIKGCVIRGMFLFLGFVNDILLLTFFNEIGLMI